MFNHGDLHRSLNSNMDLEPSAPYASASSFPSPAEYQNGEEPSLAYEKLQQICEGGTSSSGNLYSKFPFSVSTSSTGFNLAEVTSKVFPPPPLPQSFQPFSSPLIPATTEKRPLGPYFSPNKIAYRIPGTGAGSTSTSALQGILQKCGIGTTSTVESEPVKQQQRHADSLVRPTSSRITEKIRNLNEMLRSLEHYSVAKRMNSDVRREPDVKTCLNPIVQPRFSENLETSSFEQPGTTTTFGVNKALSRLEFKAQMDKLTGVIEDRWFYGGSKNVGTKGAVNTESSSSTRNVDLHMPQQEIPTPGSNPLTSVISTHLLEEMLKRVAGLEQRLTKRDKQKQSKHKGLDARGRLSVQRPAGKRMASLMQRQFKRHAACINERLDKTDLAIKSLRRQHVKTLDPFHTPPKNSGNGRERYLGQVNADDKTGSSINGQRNLSRNMVETREATEEWVEDHDMISKNLQHLEDELCSLRKENQYISHTLEKVQKLYSEQSMEIELCWGAINHLCIDNDTFRDELRAHLTSLQKPQGSSHPLNRVVEREFEISRDIQDG